MAKKDLINVADLSDMDYYSYHLPERKQFDSDEISYKELNRWYKWRMFNHRLITIFFNILPVLLTGPIFHFIWYTIWKWRVDEFGIADKNWLMTNHKYRDARNLLNASKELLDESKEAQAEESSSESSSDTSNDSDSESKPDSDDEASTVSTSALESEFIDSEELNAQWNKQDAFLLIGNKDLRKMFLKRLDDQTIIDQFVKPVFKEGRRDAILELVSRNSPRAKRFLNDFLRYHLIHNTFKYQPLTKNDLETILKEKNNRNVTCYVLTWLTKLGHQSEEVTVPLLTKLSEKSPSALFCLYTLKDSIKIPDILNYNNAFESSLYAYSNQHQLILLLKGDISEVHPTARLGVIQKLLNYTVDWKHVKFDQWPIKEQNIFLKAIIERYSNTLWWGYGDLKKRLKTFRELDFNLFNKKALKKFVDQLLDKKIIFLYEPYGKKPHPLLIILRHVLNTINDEELFITVFERLIDELQSQIDNYDGYHYSDEYIKMSNISTTIFSVNFHQIPQKIHASYVKALCRMTNIKTFTKALSSIDFQDLDKKLGDKLINGLTKASLSKSDSLDYIKALSGINISTLHPNQYDKLVKTLLNLLSCSGLGIQAVSVCTISKLNFKNFSLEDQLKFATYFNAYINEYAFTNEERESEDSSDDYNHNSAKKPSKTKRHIIKHSIQLLAQLNLEKIEPTLASEYNETLVKCVCQISSWTREALMGAQYIRLDEDTHYNLIMTTQATLKTTDLNNIQDIQNIITALYQIQGLNFSNMGDADRATYFNAFDRYCKWVNDHPGIAVLALRGLNKFKFSDLKPEQTRQYLECVLFCAYKQQNRNIERDINYNTFRQLAKQMLSDINIKKLSREDQQLLAENLVNYICDIHHGGRITSIRLSRQLKMFDEELQASIIAELFDAANHTSSKNGNQQKRELRHQGLLLRAKIKFNRRPLRMLALISDNLTDEQKNTLKTLYISESSNTKMNLLQYFWPLLNDTDKRQLLPEIKDLEESTDESSSMGYSSG